MSLRDIRSQASTLTKMVDEFVAFVESDNAEKNALLNKKMKLLATLEEREKNLSSAEEGMKKERMLISKEQEALSTRQKQIEVKEQDLNKKIKRVNELLQS